MAKINKAIPGQLKIRTTKNGSQYIYIKPVGEKRFLATGLTNTRENILIAEKALKEMFLETKEIIEKQEGGNIQSLIDEFLLKCKYKELSVRTIHLYTTIIRKYFQFNYNIDEKIIINNKKIYRLEHDLKQLLLNSSVGYCNSSFNTHTQVIQIFLNYLYDEEILEKPFRISKKFKKNVQQKAIMIFSEDEIQKVFWKIFSLRKPAKYDFAYWFLFLNYTGSRIGESLKLKWTNIDFENKYIMFPNKINSYKFDYFPISKKLERLLLILQRESGKRTKRKEHLFSSHCEKTYTTRLTNIQKELGIYIETRSAHSIRKSFASKLYDLRDEQKLDGSLIIELTRHKDKKMTDQIYRKYNAKYAAKMLDEVGY